MQFNQPLSESSDWHVSVFGLRLHSIIQSTRTNNTKRCKWYYRIASTISSVWFGNKITQFECVNKLDYSIVFIDSPLYPLVLFCSTHTHTHRVICQPIPFNWCVFPSTSTVDLPLMKSLVGSRTRFRLPATRVKRIFFKPFKLNHSLQFWTMNKPMNIV